MPALASLIRVVLLALWVLMPRIAALASEDDVTIEHFGTAPTLPLLVVLHGVGGPSDFYRNQARFFANHGYRVILPHYFDAGRGPNATDSNYEAWVAAVRRAINESSISSDKQPQQVVLVGYSLGASVALALGSQGEGPNAIVELYGSLPDRYYRNLKGMPPLLILHGKLDGNVSVSNGLQLSRLCAEAALDCETHIYPEDGHTFSPATLKDADQRALDFFAKKLTKFPNAATSK